MSMIDASYVLYKTPAKAEETDHGNRIRVACTNTKCGNYEISKRAARELGDNSERKEAIREMVSRANGKGQALEIFIVTDGALQASAVNPS
jgi:hypothetical protein